MESEIPSSTPTSRFSDHDNGTVTDNKTGLMWAKCTLGQDQYTCLGAATNANWQVALQAAETSVLATHTDWRLPNLKELRSIVEHKCYAPSINLDVFPNTPVTAVWSASPYTDDVAQRTWFVSFDQGFVSFIERFLSSNLHVRLVRSLQ